MKIIVTGGAGFIGSCLVRELNNMGYTDIIIVDNIAKSEKWKNLRNKQYLEYIHRDDFLARLPKFKNQVSHVIHMGACSSTTENNFDFLYKNNFEYSKLLWTFCTENNCSFIYASSAATYGLGEFGFDDNMDIKKLQPLNGYGYSKLLFDLWVEKQSKRPKQYIGFKFFNVYGPNEYCKGNMASVIFHTYNTVLNTGEMGIFKSYKSKYKDGEQLRDFIYVKDLCKVMHFMIEHPQINGLFNLGTGKARSFYDLVSITFASMGIESKINFVEMPETLREKYQYFTEAKMEKLRVAGYKEEFYSLEEGIKDYVQNYLVKDFLVY